MERDTVAEHIEAGWCVVHYSHLCAIPTFVLSEPSSAIADRIVRAIDNPSPPPKALRMSITPRRTSRLANELKFPSIETDEEDEVDSSLGAQLPRLAAFSPTQDGMTYERSPAPQITLNAPEDNPTDLISFDKTVVLSSPPVDAPVIHSPSPRSLTVSMPSVDDLLCSSPLNEDDNKAERSETLELPERSSPIPRRRSPRLSVLPSQSAIPPQQLLDPSRARTPERSRSRSPTGKKRLRNGDDKSMGNWSSAESGSDDERSRSVSPSPGKRRSKKRIKVDEDNDASSKDIKLGESLSPESAQILSSLMTPKVTTASPVMENTTPDRLPPATDWEATPVPESISVKIPKSPSPVHEPTPTQQQFSSVQRPPPGAIIHNPTTPIRGGLGTRTLLSAGSPVKLTLTPAAENPNRTPARRVPVFTAQDQSSSSGQPSLPPGSRALAPGVMYTPVFSRPPIDSPSRSPARRIPVTEAMSSDVHKRPRSPSFQVQRPPVPVPAASLTENGVETPKQPETISDDIDMNDTIIIPRKFPSTSSSSNSSIGSSRSVSSGPSKEPPSIAAPSISAIPSPSKKSISGSSQSDSRIPRIGAAPKTALLARSSRLPMPSTRTFKTGPAPTKLPPSRQPDKQPVPLRSGSSSGSDDQGSSSGPSQVKAIKKPTAVPTSRINPPAVGNVPANAAHKRKRIEKTSPPRTVVKMRQVVPGMFGGPVKAASTNVNGNTTKLLAKGDRSSSSPAKAQIPRGPVKVREVVKGTLQDYELRNETSTRMEAALNEAAVARAKEAEARKVAEAEVSRPSHGSSAFNATT
ncbi:hypothetical protein SCHPADRAFT_116308 [Schizopora paradoxa]|uniref:Uncharacterized protein n=1 Tax=Schizopora paradoxa TaxID=27342 RepID=A0A0H2SA70_9AGAM|nr:hypothetical protein SCHPADRAFT_116308 [Schizopora paradoxa]